MFEDGLAVLVVVLEGVGGEGEGEGQVGQWGLDCGAAV